MLCATCGRIHRHSPHDAEWARFLEEHKTRRSYDLAWANALWDRTFPDDAFCIEVLRGRAGFIKYKETQHDPK